MPGREDRPGLNSVVSPSLIKKDGKTIEVWCMPDGKMITCCMPGCGRLVAKTKADAELALFLCFPSRKGNNKVSMFYFCGWNCLANWVRANDEMRTATVDSIPAVSDTGAGQPPGPEPQCRDQDPSTPGA